MIYLHFEILREARFWCNFASPQLASRLNESCSNPQDMRLII